MKYRFLHPLFKKYKSLHGREPSAREFKKFYRERTSEDLKSDSPISREFSQEDLDQWPWEEIVTELKGI